MIVLWLFYMFIQFDSFSPTDCKLATSSTDGTVRVFDFIRCSEEFILRGEEKSLLSFLVMMNMLLLHD